MSPTRDCFPVTYDFLATALKVQTECAGLLDEWKAWLASGSRLSNAEQLQLWQLINSHTSRKQGPPPGPVATGDATVLR